jgi:RNA polymerase sigma factor (sigma-70 family)
MAPPRNRGGSVADSGEDHDFDGCYRAQIAGLIRFLCMMGATNEEAYDVAQDTFAALLVNWSTVNEPAAWIRTVATRKLRDRFRRRRVEMAALTRMRVFVQPGFEPVYAVDDADIVEMIMKGLRSLPPRQREVMAWTVSGYSPTEIAPLIGITAESVRGSLRKARLALKKLVLDHRGRAGGELT